MPASVESVASSAEPWADWLLRFSRWMVFSPSSSRLPYSSDNHQRFFLCLSGDITIIFHPDLNLKGLLPKETVGAIDGRVDVGVQAAGHVRKAICQHFGGVL